MTLYVFSLYSAKTENVSTVPKEYIVRYILHIHMLDDIQVKPELQSSRTTASGTNNIWLMLNRAQLHTLFRHIVIIANAHLTSDHYTHHNNT